MSDSVQRIEELRQEGGLFLLYFFNDHCAPCLSLRPRVEEMLNKEFPGVRCLFIDTSANPALSASFGIFSAPVIIIMADGREFRRFSKHISLPELRESVERLRTLMED